MISESDYCENIKKKSLYTYICLLYIIIEAIKSSIVSDSTRSDDFAVVVVFDILDINADSDLMLISYKVVHLCMASIESTQPGMFDFIVE